MSTTRAISVWTPGGAQTWRPTTLDKIGKSEEFFESVLADAPELMGLQSRSTGIHGPYRVFRQLSLPTPSGRTIFPDIALLTASGHLIVVEVKLGVNSELRDRSVIAQIIDYASSIAAAAKEEGKLASLFDADHASSTWGDLICELFPDEDHQDELAQTLLNRMRAGEINLVIACDRIPPGLPEIVEGIASQRTLGFDLDLVEVVPFMQDDPGGEGIVFVPSTRLSTEIVARTAVTVTYRQGDEEPSTRVEITSAEEISSRMATAKSTSTRKWTCEEVEEAFKENGDANAMALLDFCKEHSSEGQIVPNGPRQNPGFGFYVRGARADGRVTQLVIFSLVGGWESIYLKLNSAESILDNADFEEFRTRLKETFGDDVDVTMTEPGISLAAVGEHLADFQQLMRWLSTRATARVNGAVS